MPSAGNFDTAGLADVDAAISNLPLVRPNIGNFCNANGSSPPLGGSLAPASQPGPHFQMPAPAG